MAIALRGTGSDSNSSGATGLSPGWNVTPTNGDLCLAFISSIVQSGITIPAGWNLLGSYDMGSSLRAWAYWKVANNEAGGYNFTLGSAAKSWAWIGAYSGAKTDTAPAFGQDGDLDTALLCPSLAVPASGWLVNAAATRRAATGAAASFTINDAQAVERFEFHTNAGSGNDAGGAVYDSNRALTAGNVQRTITSNTGQDMAVVFSVAFAPAVAPDPPAPVGGSFRGWGVHL